MTASADPRAARVFIDGHGCKPALIFPGRKWSRIVIVTPKVIVVKMGHGELERRESPFDYPVKRAASRLRGIARRHGSTKTARRLLRGL